MQLETPAGTRTATTADVKTRRGLHPTNVMLKQRLLTAEHWLCIERARYATEVWRRTEGLHPSLRAARALENVLAKMTVRIDAGELLVGNRSSKPIAPPLALERGDFTFVFKYLLEDLEAFGYRITPEDRRELLDDLIPWWAGRTVRDAKVAALEAHGLSSPPNASPLELVRKLRAFGPRTLGRVLSPRGGSSEPAHRRLPRLLRAIRAGAKDNVKGRGRCTDTQAHIVPGHKNVLALGFSGIRAQARERLGRATSADERGFLEAVVVTCEAMRDFSQRFATLVRARQRRSGVLSGLQIFHFCY